MWRVLKTDDWLVCWRRVLHSPFCRRGQRDLSGSCILSFRAPPCGTVSGWFEEGPLDFVGSAVFEMRRATRTRRTPSRAVLLRMCAKVIGRAIACDHVADCVVSCMTASCWDFTAKEQSKWTRCESVWQQRILQGPHQPSAPA